MILGQGALIHPATPWRVGGHSGDFLYLGYFQHCMALLVGVVGVLSTTFTIVLTRCAVTGMLFSLLTRIFRLK